MTYGDIWRVGFAFLLELVVRGVLLAGVAAMIWARVIRAWRASVLNTA